SPCHILRAASFGISTAQPLKTGLRRSFTAIARCGLVLQSKRKISVTFANRDQQDGSQTPMVPSSHNIFVIPFHTSGVGRAKSGWGRPYDCNKSVEAARKPICEMCKVNPTVDVYAYPVPGWDRKGIVDYDFTSFCKDCKQKMQKDLRKMKEAEGKAEAALEERVNKMREHLRSLPPGELVPFVYVVEKMAREPQVSRLAAMTVIALLDRELRIVKVGNRWMCDKGRMDAMDFEGWNGELNNSSEAVYYRETQRQRRKQKH
ncbi:hypothetical protein QBC32DRAFT_225605, partial [Pseudoneurospora amorphoporcata]